MISAAAAHKVIHPPSIDEFCMDTLKQSCMEINAPEYKNLDVIIFDLCQRSFKSEKPQRDARLNSYK